MGRRDIKQINYTKNIELKTELSALKERSTVSREYVTKESDLGCRGRECCPEEITLEPRAGYGLGHDLARGGNRE